VRVGGSALDETQKVDGRDVEVLRLDVRDQRRPGSVALDRGELHKSISVVRLSFVFEGKRSKIGV
jgi:hypothetical protein